jgi:hypothetical protein
MRDPTGADQTGFISSIGFVLVSSGGRSSRGFALAYRACVCMVARSIDHMLRALIGWLSVAAMRGTVRVALRSGWR